MLGAAKPLAGKAPENRRLSELLARDAHELSGNYPENQTRTDVRAVQAAVLTQKPAKSAYKMARTPSVK